MGNQRLYWRACVRKDITCQIANEGGKDYPVTDISPSGLSFLCDKDIPAGTLLKLKIKLRFAGVIEENNASVNVKHCRKSKDKFTVGCCYVRKRMNV